MKKPNPEHVERIFSFINNANFFSLTSMKIRDIGVGYSLFEIDLEEKHLHPFGQVHGGVIASIIDSAATWAIFYGIEDEKGGVITVDLKLNFLAPAESGKITARGSQVNLGRTLGYAEVHVNNENDRLLAHGTSTIMILPGKFPDFNPPLPPKFLEY